MLKYVHIVCVTGLLYFNFGHRQRPDALVLSFYSPVVFKMSTSALSAIRCASRGTFRQLVSRRYKLVIVIVSTRMQLRRLNVLVADWLAIIPI